MGNLYDRGDLFLNKVAFSDINYFDLPEISHLISIANEIGLSKSFEHSLEGKATAKDVVELYKAPLWLLGATARFISDKIAGKRVGYIVNKIFNYTNICVVGCSFCAFHRPPGDNSGYLVEKGEAIASVVKDWMTYGIRQLLFQGGVNPSVPIEYFEEVFRGVKQRTKGSVAIHGLSVVEIDFYSRINRVSVKEFLSRLINAGLDSVPGGGAEVLSQRVRDIISPRKTDVKRWIELMDKIMSLGVPMSSTMMYGHVETLLERAEHLLKILEIQRKRGLVMSFISWNFEPSNTQLKEKVPYVASGSEHLRNVSVARIVFRHEVPWIQSGWLTAGVRLGQVSLEYGATDWGGTLYGERVLPSAGVPLPKLIRGNVEKVIREAGYEPYERDNFYRPV